MQKRREIKQGIYVAVLLCGVFYLFSLMSGTESFADEKAATSEKPPPSTYTDPVTGMEFVYIPGGEFMMGSEKYYDTTPVHKVKLDGFYMGVYKVNMGEFLLFVKESGWHKAEFHEDGDCTKSMWREKEKKWQTLDANQKKHFYVDCITWDGATAFAKWLSKKSGKHYSLPTEAQWEYVAHVGLLRNLTLEGNGQKEGSKGVNGGNISSPQRALKEKNNIKLNYNQTLSEFSKKFSESNAFGVYGIIGDGVEFCFDFYTEDYYTHSPAMNPQGPPIGMKLEDDPYSTESRYIESSDHIIRGGGRGSLLSSLLFYRALPVNSWEFYSEIGFRLVLSLADTPPSK